MDAIKKVDGNVTARKIRGFALTSELVLVSTITVLGLTAGLTLLRDATTAELNDLSEAVGSLDQSYGLTGIEIIVGGDTTGVGAFSAGSFFLDGIDSGAGDDRLWTFTAPDATEGGAPFAAPTGASLD